MMDQNTKVNDTSGYNAEIYVINTAGQLCQVISVENWCCWWFEFFG
jgi:hypothetical protein